MNDLRQAVIKLAHEVPEMRKHLVPILRKTAAPNYQDYVEDKRKDGKKPLSKEEWERKVLQTGPAQDSTLHEEEDLETVADDWRAAEAIQKKLKSGQHVSEEEAKAFFKDVDSRKRRLEKKLPEASPSVKRNVKEMIERIETMRQKLVNRMKKDTSSD